MGNIGSEVGRAIISHRQVDIIRENRTIDRAIDLFSGTVEVTINTPYCYRLKEVLRVRDEFLKLFFAETFDQDADNIDHYFLFFAYLARAEHLAAGQQ